MKQLKNFTPTRRKVSKDVPTNEDSVNANASDVEEMIKDRQNRTEKELMDELMANVKKSKAEGRFSEKDMQNFKNTVSPMLTLQQRKKLDEILETLNKG